MQTALLRLLFKTRLRAAGLVLGVALTSGFVWLWPHWIFLWDHVGHRGFFLCGTHEGPLVTELYCGRGVDEPILQERRFANGVVVRSWYAGNGVIDEYAREVERPGRPTVEMRRRGGPFRYWSVEHLEPGSEYAPTPAQEERQQFLKP